jgi:hypothetical protein
MLAELITALPEPSVFEWLPTDTWGRVIGIVMIIFIGWQGRGFIIAYREDRRKAAADEIDLLEEVKKITRDEMVDLRNELDRERRERQRLSARVFQLEKILHDHGLDIPV